METFKRRDLILSENQIEKLDNLKIALFGLGGVGGYVLDLFVRMGIKDFILVDGDKFTQSNLNRQLLSNINTIGLYKVDVGKSYIKSINENAKVKTFNVFINENNITDLNLDGYYIVDCIDDTKAKVLLAKIKQEKNLKMISMMGAGNRLFADFIVSDIYKTSVDPLSKKMRTLLKNEGINDLKVVYTKSDIIKHESNDIASIDYVVQAAANKIVSEVIREILYEE